MRETTRFKGKGEGSGFWCADSCWIGVDVPSRDEEVIQGAVNPLGSTGPVLPEIIAAPVFEAIINSSVPFEKCAFGSFNRRLGLRGRGNRNYHSDSQTSHA